MIRKPLNYAFITLLLGTAPGFAAGTSTWTGLGGDSNWNNTSNWSANGVPDEDADIAEFGSAVTSPLVVTLSGSTPRSYMLLAKLQVTSDSQANVSFTAPTDSLINSVTLQSGGTYTRTTINTYRLRVSQNTTWDIGAEKTLQLNATVWKNVAGAALTVTKTGSGLLNFTGTTIGQALGDNDNTSLNLSITDGSLAINAGVGQTIQYISSATAGRTTSLTVGAGGTLAIDVGTGGDMIEYVRATGNGTTEAYSADWLNVASGATLEVNLLEGFEEGTWYTLFRNISSAPENEFEVTGLSEGQIATFRLNEYSAGLNDYQIMISQIPESSSTSYGLGLGVLAFFIWHRFNRRCAQG